MYKSTKGNLLKYITKKFMPENLFKVFKIRPQELPINAYSRIGCTHCGLYARSILCPPLLSQTYPQYRTIDSSVEYFNAFDWVYVYVFKNDGTKKFWFKGDDKDFGHWRFKKAKPGGRTLKGVEKVGSRYLTGIMFKLRSVNRKRGFAVETYIPGH